MRYHEIMEASLKLLPNETRKVRGSYGAFILTMNPMDFLRLTTGPRDLERIENTAFPQSDEEFLDRGGSSDQLGRFSIPFLNVEWPNGRITGHEGRHRALMIHRAGGTKFPVVIYMRHQVVYELHYEEWNADTEEETNHVEHFDDYKTARARADELKQWNTARQKGWEEGTEEYHPILFFKVKLETISGSTIKGSPTNVNPDDPWERKAFEISDMPKQLLGQYDQSIRVTDYRVGRVKGYRHFR